MANITIAHTIPPSLREDAVRLYDEAFGAKFQLAVKDTAQRRELLMDSVCLPFAFAALAEGELAGLAGYCTADGSFTGGLNTAMLWKHLKLWRGIRAACVFSLYERTRQADELLLDGIAVDARWRGRGIGTQLLEQVKAHAKAEGLTQVRLDVVDTNPQARQLYARCGFIVEKEEKYPLLRPLLGFGGSATMRWRVDK